MNSRKKLKFSRLSNSRCSGLVHILGLSGFMSGTQVFHERRVYGWLNLGRERVPANGAALNLAIGNQVWQRVE